MLAFSACSVFTAAVEKSVKTLMNLDKAGATLTEDWSSTSSAS